MSDQQKPYQWLIEELEDAMEFNTRHEIDNAGLIPLLEKAKDKQRESMEGKYE